MISLLRNFPCPVTSMPSPAIVANMVYVGGRGGFFGIFFLYILRVEREESIDINIFVVGLAKVIWISRPTITITWGGGGVYGRIHPQQAFLESKNVAKLNKRVKNNIVDYKKLWTIEKIGTKVASERFDPAKPERMNTLNPRPKYLQIGFYL